MDPADRDRHVYPRPGWIWFWPGQTWDHNAVVFDKNVDLHDMIAMSSIGKALHLGVVLTDTVGKMIFGAIVVGGFYIIGALFFHWLMTVDFKRIRFRRPFKENLFPRSVEETHGAHQFASVFDVPVFAVSVLLALPVKLILRLALTIKYVWVTPWFNI